MSEVRKCKDDKGFHEPYAKLADRLRGWLLAYGIGAPVLFVSQDRISNALNQSQCSRFVISLFLAGISIQIVASFIYKASMWYLYVGEYDPEFCKTYRFRVSDWFSEQFWIEALSDLGSIVLFGIGTYIALTATIP